MNAARVLGTPVCDEGGRERFWHLHEFGWVRP